MTSTQKDVKLNIKKIKDTIKKKYKELKNRAVQSEREEAIKFKPIIEPIKQLSEKLIKQELTTEIKESPSESVRDPLENAEHDDDSERDWENFLVMNNIGPNISPYLRLLDGDISDTTYGVKWYDDGYKIGDHSVRFDGNNFVIGNERYPATDGLLELVFTKTPDPNTFNDNDLTTYKAILEKTRAHLKSDGKINSNSGSKYNNIIKNLFPPKGKKRGKGMQTRYAPYMKLSSASIDYRYWDDPNELVVRLRLLIASKQAGNTGHDSEIISILEELVEAGIIKDFGNFQL